MIRVTANSTPSPLDHPWLHDEAALDAEVNRPQRLQTLQRSGLLSSDLDDSFDALTRLAATLLAAPVAFMGVPDVGLDRYPSACGLPEPLATQHTMTGRTFCHYTLAARTVLAIDDTRLHAPWQHVPTVQSLGVAAYIGVPIVLDGEVVASLCVVDTKPRTWQASDIEAMVQLGLSAQRELALRSALALATDRLHAHETSVARTAHHLRGHAQVLQLCAIQMRRGTDAARNRASVRLDHTVEAIQQHVQELQAETLSDTIDPEQLIVAGDLLHEAVKLMLPLAEQRGIHLGCAVQSMARCRVAHGRMLRVLNTLIGEGIRAMPAGTALTATLDEVGDRLHFVIHAKPPSSADGQPAAAEAADAAPSWLLVETLLKRHGGVLTIDGDGVTGMTFTAALAKAPMAA